MEREKSKVDREGFNSSCGRLPTLRTADEVTAGKVVQAKLANCVAATSENAR